MASNLPDEMDLVCRLACFGSEEGTYNVLNQQAPLDQSQEPSIKLLTKSRGREALKRLKTIAHQKRYVNKKNMLYSLAHIISSAGAEAFDHKTDSLSNQAYGLVQELCDSPSDLFRFVYLDKKINSPSKAMWGRGMRNLITKWYTKKSPDVLAFEATQCKSGHGFNHKDLLKLVHMKCEGSSSKARDLALTYLLRGKSALEKFSQNDAEGDEEFKKVYSLLGEIERLKASDSTETEIIRGVIEANKLQEKQIPSHFFKLRETFEGLLDHMTLESLVRSIPKMAEKGVLDPTCSDAEKVIERLEDTEGFKKESISPVTVFISMRKYDVNRLKKWIRNNKMSASLHLAYEAALDTLMSTGQRYLLAVHIDDKIAKTCVVGSASTLSPIMPCTILAQALARVEAGPQFAYFKNGKMTELKLSRSMTTVAIVEELIQQTKDPLNDQYDLCDPLKWAVEKKKAFDCILIVSGKKKISSQDDFKDSITKYRTECGVPNAKVAIIGLCDQTPLPDRTDLNYLDITGFGEEVPLLLQQFFKGIPAAE